jgi:hypothetical protein
LDLRNQEFDRLQGPKDSPGSKGQYANVAVHPGLMCLNGPEGMGLNMQLELFEQALDELTIDGDLVNQVLEVSVDDEDNLHILRCELPAS